MNESSGSWVTSKRGITANLQIQKNQCTARNQPVIQTCSRRSTASGLASWFSSKVSCRNFSASADMSEGIVGLAEEPICRKVINHDRSHTARHTFRVP